MEKITTTLTTEDLLKAIDKIKLAINAGTLKDGHLQINQSLVKNMDNKLECKAKLTITISVVIEASEELMI